jgi:pyruvate-formate lyase-activating enzyme
MTNHVWQLPWKGNLVPHAVLDVLRGCNITCRACYNIEPAHAKSLDEVRKEFRMLTARRRLDSISLLGGEPTLHPQLCDVVRMIKAEGISVELFTNGLLLETDLLHKLRDAGTDLIFLHIDANQTRPELAEHPTADRLREFRVQRAAAVAATGMEVGLTMTAYADTLPEIDEGVRFVLTSPHVDYLVVTLFRDVPTLGPITGNMDIGMRAKRSAISPGLRHDDLTNEMVRTRLFNEFGLWPFAYLGSNHAVYDLRWVSYLVGTVLGDSGSSYWAGLKVSLAEKLFLAIHGFLHGRYPFYLRQNPRRFRLQLLLNAITGGAAWGNLALLVQSLRKHSHLRTKRLLFQRPAEVADDGTIIHCNCCPDATIRYGQLVPVCISDQVMSGPQPEQESDGVAID